MSEQAPEEKPRDPRSFGGDLGDRCKALELAEAGRAAMPGLPILVRLDGRAFHTYTRGLERPYSERFGRCMIEAASQLVEEFQPAVGYTQSDEITLAWTGRSELPFSGRWQKLCSVLAGFCSSAFHEAAHRTIPERSRLLPHFDARAWQVPSLAEALDVFAWREDDAVKNSVQMAAQSVASRNQLHGKGRKDQLDILHAAGISWNAYPVHFKRGVYLRRVARERELTDEERSRIPEAHRPAPGTKFTRSVVEQLAIGPIKREPAALQLLFGGAGEDAP